MSRGSIFTSKLSEIVELIRREVSYTDEGQSICEYPAKKVRVVVETRNSMVQDESESVLTDGQLLRERGMMIFMMSNRSPEARPIEAGKCPGDIIKFNDRRWLVRAVNYSGKKTHREVFCDLDENTHECIPCEDTLNDCADS